MTAFAPVLIMHWPIRQIRIHMKIKILYQSFYITSVEMKDMTADPILSQF